MQKLRHTLSDLSCRDEMLATFGSSVDNSTQKPGTEVKSNIPQVKSGGSKSYKTLKGYKKGNYSDYLALDNFDFSWNKRTRIPLANSRNASRLDEKPRRTGIGFHRKTTSVIEE